MVSLLIEFPCTDPNLSKEARDKQRSEMNYDSQRLASFLRSASQVFKLFVRTVCMKNFLSCC